MPCSGQKRMRSAGPTRRQYCKNKRGILPNKTRVTIQSPDPTDGYELNRLIEKSPPLDSNSVYCNLLQCSHFSDTCISAQMDGRLVGFISGYLMPRRPNTLFVWQVVVAEDARGQGLANRMLQALLDRPACSNIDFIETTITPDNKASQGLFTQLAATLSAEVKTSAGFDEILHFNREHSSEELWRIGPITKDNKGAQT